MQYKTLAELEKIIWRIILTIPTVTAASVDWDCDGFNDDYESWLWIGVDTTMDSHPAIKMDLDFAKTATAEEIKNEIGKELNLWDERCKTLSNPPSLGKTS